ncbi:MAG: SAM-dependent methyltransferase [Desulfotignum sp.]|nr:SAM-dependent methyltransferase [Desulfotignum sp.]MCF8112588.1 SAM-dependent methyltransferase [Desulfotignum sp.]MCF8124980.1 SAM-dependent methyltransferase [Desulfotignum sp.]
MLSDIEQSRLAISKATDPKKKSLLGQFFTPATIARFMAELFDQNSHDHCRLLDPGAGIGSLCAAFLDRWTSGGLKFKDVHIDVFEIDPFLQPYLMQTLKKYENIPGFSMDIGISDFIITASEGISGNLFVKPFPRYTHAILNPPYKKIRSDSKHRSALRRAGIETVNLYSAFLALSLSLLKPHGQLVAIVPRSFCNGPYYRRFRKFLLTRAAIRQIHLFLSRNKAFKDDDVLQENIIICLEKNEKKGQIKISTSTDDNFYDLTSQKYPFEKIVRPDDPEQFIHIPTSTALGSIALCKKVSFSLFDLKINISTGPVVDFRVKEHLRKMPVPGTVPLLYPVHFNSKGIEWPKPDIKKPNAIQHNNETEKWLFPNDFYCVVRRFSSKEEKRRIVANVVNPDNFPGMPSLGFENHLNVFHAKKQGLPKNLAYGIMVFLNSTAVDDFFRTFNGHTQVNAADLKQIKYPSLEVLIMLGKWSLNQLELTQEMIDEKLETITT